MIYGFDTTDEHAATAALLLYVVYRSRDRRAIAVTPDFWGRIERALKDSAKRAQSLPELLDALKSPRHIHAPTLHPRYLECGVRGEIPLTAVHDADGNLRYAIQWAADRDTGRREFGTQVIERADARAVIACAYRQTSWVVLLVRDRIERERPIEEHLNIIDPTEAAA